MNRIVVCGLAIFFAIVGIALLGGNDKAMAFGHRCGGCSGNSCNGGNCGGNSCCGGHHRHHRNRCHGRCSGSCNGGCNGGGCCGGGGYAAPMEKQAPAPAQVPGK